MLLEGTGSSLEKRWPFKLIFNWFSSFGSLSVDIQARAKNSQSRERKIEVNFSVFPLVILSRCCYNHLACLVEPSAVMEIFPPCPARRCLQQHVVGGPLTCTDTNRRPDFAFYMILTYLNVNSYTGLVAAVLKSAAQSRLCFWHNHSCLWTNWKRNNDFRGLFLFHSRISC